MIKQIDSIADCRNTCKSLTHAGKSLGFVPTMGNLHAGHLSLVKKSLAENDITIVSIFVNPAQFGPQEDFDNYPRTLQADLNALETLGQSLLCFLPNQEDIYPKSNQGIQIDIPQLTQSHCGTSRPHFFGGVLSIVLSLFNIIKPTKAYFGKKDYQQYLTIDAAVKALHMDTIIVPCPLVREENGLAMSSRNNYFSKNERQHAGMIHTILRNMEDMLQSKQAIEEVLELGTKKLEKEGFLIDYLSIVNPSTLQPITTVQPIQMIMVAVHFHDVRLIDNIEVIAQ